jgi:hypothetical protein
MYMKIWRNGTALDCGTEDRTFEPARLTLIYAGTVEIFRRFSKYSDAHRNIPNLVESLHLYRRNLSD